MADASTGGERDGPPVARILLFAATAISLIGTVASAPLAATRALC